MHTFMLLPALLALIKLKCISNRDAIVTGFIARHLISHGLTEIMSRQILCLHAFALVTYCKINCCLWLLVKSNIALQTILMPAFAHLRADSNSTSSADISIAHATLCLFSPWLTLFWEELKPIQSQRHSLEVTDHTASILCMLLARQLLI